MIKLLAPLALALALVVALAALWPRPAPDPMQTWYESEQLRLQIAQQEADAARWAGFWNIALPLGGILAGVVLAGGVFFAGVALWERRRPLVFVEALQAPVDRRALHNGTYRDLPVALLAARVETARAAGPQVPSHLTLHNAYRSESTGAPPAQLAGPVPAFVPLSIGEAAERGAFRDGKYILGYQVADGQPVTLDQESGRSLLIAGQGGSGGTTALLAAGLQEILMPFYLPGQQEPARFIVVDYHARKPQGLLQRIGDELGDRILYAAHRPDEVAQAVRLFETECRARVDGAPTPSPLILLVDEVGNLVDDDAYRDVLPGLLAAFRHANNAYRAVGGKAIVRAHTLQSSAWGNTATIRQSFHARAGMRLDEGAGVLLGLRPAVARTLLALPAGQSYVTGPGLAPTHVVSSNVKRGDMGLVLDLAGYRARGRTVHPVGNLEQNSAECSLLPQNSAEANEDRGLPLTDSWWNVLTGGRQATGPAPDFTPTSAPEGNAEGSPEGNAGAGGRQPAGNPEGNAAAGDPTAVRIFALFMGAGADLPTIVEQIYGVSSTTGGRRYSAALRTAQQLLRDEIARRRAPYEGEAI